MHENVTSLLFLFILSLFSGPGADNMINTCYSLSPKLAFSSNTFPGGDLRS